MLCIAAEYLENCREKGKKRVGICCVKFKVRYCSRLYHSSELRHCTEVRYCTRVVLPSWNTLMSGTVPNFTTVSDFDTVLNFSTVSNFSTVPNCARVRSSECLSIALIPPKAICFLRVMKFSTVAKFGTVLARHPAILNARKMRMSFAAERQPERTSQIA